MPIRRPAAARRVGAPAFPHPGDDKARDAMTSGEIHRSAFGPVQGGSNIVDVQAVSGLPPLEVPPCLTVQQWLDIMNNGQ
jgi:hypothetical protein